MTIGQRIAELRKQQNLSQEALGELLGVSRQAISKWESDAALPEIDKLIAMSKRFGVTVGYLLGVEEEAVKGEEPAPEREGPTEAEVLENYLNSLPKRKPISKKWRVVCAIILAIFFFCVLDYIDGLENRISSLSNTVSHMTNQMSNVQNELYGISDDISTKIDEALKQEYGLLANWKMEVVELNYGEGTAVIELNAVLKNRNEAGGGLSFYAQLQDGSYVMAEDGTWNSETNSYTARLTLSMTESDIAYYLTTPDGTVCLASDYNHELCNLEDGTQLQVWCNMSTFSNRAGIGGWVHLDVNLPWMLSKDNHNLGEIGEPDVKVWLVYNGERKTQLMPEPRHSFMDSWMYECNINVTNDKIDPAPKEGDRIWVEYEVSFSNGLSAVGTGDEAWTFTQSGTWDMYEGVVAVD